MIYKFECSACGQRISATLDSYGTTVHCPACGVAFVVPNPSKADFERLAELITSFPDSIGESGGAGIAEHRPPPSIYKFHCSVCGQRMSAPPERFGSTDHCPTCGAEFIVPTP